MHRLVPLRRAASVVIGVLTLVGVAAVGGCANAPAYRPVGPPMGTAGFESGGGVHGVIGEKVGGVGVGAWVTGQVAKDILIVGRGHFTDLFPYNGSGGVLSDIQYGGAFGFRGVYAIRPELLMGGEATIDYLEFRDSQTGEIEQYVSGIASFPVAEQATENVWVYVNPSIGAGFRFGDVEQPFSGFTEIPIGVAWKASENAVVVVEGGFAIPFNGGYLGVGGAWRW